MFEGNFQPLSPLPFFQVRSSCYYVEPEQAPQMIKNKTYCLPSLEKLTQEFHFAQLNMGWNELGLYFLCEVNSPFQDVFYPDFDRGDSLEIFIDTRDVKTSRFISKFCHHFFFLPQAVDDHKAEEVTRFRNEDSHELCDPKDLHVKSEIHRKGYTLNIYIPSHCLYGYDPSQFKRLGFTYKINRVGQSSQHFSVLSEEFKIDQPSLWGTIILKNSP